VTLDELLDIIQQTPGRATISLQPEQRKIVETSEGPLWVIAGPGSGKTETLVLRCLRLIYVDRVDPRSIMVTTFTEKAARELEDRLGDYAAWITESAPREEVEYVDITHVRVGTLHSICNDVLLEYRYPAYQNVRLMDGLEQLVFINEHSELARRTPEPRSPERRLWTEFAGLLGGWPNQPAARRMRWQPNRAKGFRDLVGRIVEYRVDVDHLREAGAHWARLAEGYEDYVSKLRELRRSDFSHVQKTFFEFLEDPKGQLFLHGDESQDHPGLRHVLVDEYQDTNPIQEAIYFRLTGTEPYNLMVVGDDDQAIFRFRGGTVESLINFNRSCESHWGIDADLIDPVPLYDNFRSHRRVVDWCNHYVTSFAQMREPGARAPGKRPLDALSSLNTQFGDYPSVSVISGPRTPDLARVFASTVEELITSGTVTDPSDCALLLRSVRETRLWARPYVEALRSRGIDTYNPRAKTFMDQEEVRASLGALLAVLDPGLDACPSQLSVYPTQWNDAYQALLPSAPELDDYVTRARAQIASKGPVTRLATGAMELFYILLSFPPFSDWKEENLDRSVRLAKLTRILEAYTSMP
jgi:DNA helicase-2/ATP-dependent DNA helicase PcrA